MFHNSEMKNTGRNQCLFIWMPKIPGVATLSANQYFGQRVMPAILGSNVIFTSGCKTNLQTLAIILLEDELPSELDTVQFRRQKKNQHRERSQNLASFVNTDNFQISPSKLKHSTFP